MIGTNVHKKARGRIVLNEGADQVVVGRIKVDPMSQFHRRVLAQTDSVEDWLDRWATFHRMHLWSRSNGLRVHLSVSNWAQILIVVMVLPAVSDATTPTAATASFTRAVQVGN